MYNWTVKLELTRAGGVTAERGACPVSAVQLPDRVETNPEQDRSELLRFLFRIFLTEPETVCLCFRPLCVCL